MSMMWSNPVGRPYGEPGPSSSLWWATGWIRPVPAPDAVAGAGERRSRGRIRTRLLLIWWGFWLRRGLSRALSRQPVQADRPVG